MIVFEEIRKELKKVKEEYEEAKEKLKEFEKGKKQKRLDELEDKLADGKWTMDQKKVWKDMSFLCCVIY